MGTKKPSTGAQASKPRPSADQAEHERPASDEASGGDPDDGDAEGADEADDGTDADDSEHVGEHDGADESEAAEEAAGADGAAEDRRDDEPAPDPAVADEADEADRAAAARERRRARARQRRARRAERRPSGEALDGADEPEPDASAAPARRRRKRKRAAAHVQRRTGAEEAVSRVGQPWTAEQRRVQRWGLLLAAVLIVAFYGYTVCRWIGLGDTALLIDEIKKLNVNSHVNNHTTAIFFGWLFQKLPFGEIALKANLTSVAFGSASMVVMFAIVYRTLRRLLPSLLATFTIVVMHSMWWHSTIVENYAFNSLALLVVLLLLLKDEEETHSKYYYAACLVSGLAVVNHVQMGSLSVVVFIYAILQRKKGNYGLISRWLKMAGFYLIGLLPYILIFIRDVENSGQFIKTLYWATGGDFQSRMFDFQWNQATRGLMMQFLIQFPTPMLAFAVLGVDHLFDKKFYPKAHAATAACFVINTFFFMQFNTWDKFAFLLPSFLLVGYWGVVGVKSLYERLEGRNPWWERGLLAALVFSVVFPPFFYQALPKWGREAGFWHGRFNNNFTRNTHDCAGYIANPNKRGWSDMASFAELLFKKLPPRSIFLDDDGRTYYPLHEYYQVYYQRRPDITFLLLNSWGFANWGVTEDAFVKLVQREIDRRPIFLVSLQHPHQKIVARLGELGIAPKHWPLDDKRWIYRLERIPKGADAPPLVVTDTMVGEHFSANVPVLKSDFDPDESITVKVEFLKNSAPVVIHFVWRTPSGEVYFQSEPFTIPPDNTSVWSHLDREGGRPSGEWTVEAVVDDRVLSKIPFTVH